MEAHAGRRGGEHGSLSAEYAGLLVLVAALVAAILALPVGNLVGAWLEHAVCLVVRAGCAVPSHAEPRDPAEPSRCDVSVHAVDDEGHANLLFVEVGGVEGYELVERSDGTVTVTYRIDSTSGATASGGGYGRLDLGEAGVAVGYTASAAIHRVDANGVTWTFDDRGHAEEWIEWHRAMEAPLARYETPVSMRWYNPHAWGGRSSVGAMTERAGRWAGERVARAFGRSHGPPSEPARSHEFVRGGWSAEALARAGVPGIDVEARLRGASQLGQQTDLDTGETTFYWELTSAIGLRESAIGGHEATAGFELDGRVGVTVDADGYATHLEIATSAPGEAGLDPTALDDPRDVLDPWDARMGPASLYELTLAMPLERLDLGEVIDALSDRSGATSDDHASLADELWSHGSVGLVERHRSARRYGAEVTGRVGVVGAGLGGARVHTEGTSRDAYFLSSPDRGGTRAWHRWTNCAGS